MHDRATPERVGVLHARVVQSVGFDDRTPGEQGAQVGGSECLRRAYEERISALAGQVGVVQMYLCLSPLAVTFLCEPDGAFAGR